MMKREIIQTAMCLVIAAAFFLNPASLLAQENSEQSVSGKPPRPDLVFDGSVHIRGSSVTRYFREAKSKDNDGCYASNTRLLHEPVIALVTNEDNTLKTDISDNGHLVLYVFWDTNRRETKSRIRQHLAKEYNCEEKQIPLAGNIRMFYVSNSWFASKRNPDLTSRLLPNQSFANIGEEQIHFSLGSREVAQTLIADLHEGRDSLVFSYSFTGDVEILCSATASYKMIQKIGQFKDLSGEGREGFVSRHQVARIAGDIHRHIEVKAKCRSSALAAQMAQAATDQLDDPEPMTLKDSWTTLEEFTTLQANDFAADLTTHTSSIKNRVRRKQIQEITSNAKSRAISGGIDAYFTEISAAGADSDLRSDFKDILNKMGISVKWDGQKFVPKSIEVYRKEDLERNWEGGVKREYLILDRAKANYSIDLPKANWINAPPLASPIDGRAMMRSIDQLTQQFQETDQQFQETDQRLQEVDQRLTQQVREKADEDWVRKRTRRKANKRWVRDWVRDWIDDTIVSRHYSIHLEGTSSRDKIYTTNESVSTYPHATIGGWSGTECSDAELGTLAVSQENNRWAILVRESSGCEAIDVVVTFFTKKILGKMEGFGNNARGRKNLRLH